MVGDPIIVSNTARARALRPESFLSGLSRALGASPDQVDIPICACFQEHKDTKESVSKQYATSDSMYACVYIYIYKISTRPHFVYNSPCRLIRLLANLGYYF